MERAVIKSILANAELSDDAKLEQIMNLNGADITREKDTAKQIKADLEAANSKLAGFSDYDRIKTELDAERAKNAAYADHDAIVAERDALKAEKEERIFDDRFDKVMGSNKFKNDFTRDGVKKMFRDELSKEENKEKKDDEILKSLVTGHETEYFDSPVKLNMTPHNPGAKAPNEIDEIIATKYKDNPWIN